VPHDIHCCSAVLFSRFRHSSRPPVTNANGADGLLSGLEALLTKLVLQCNGTDRAGFLIISHVLSETVLVDEELSGAM
jgi:hypothetical protein